MDKEVYVIGLDEADGGEDAGGQEWLPVAPEPSSWVARVGRAAGNAGAEPEGTGRGSCTRASASLAAVNASLDAKCRMPWPACHIGPAPRQPRP